MFLSRRSTQAEYFDTERPADELVEFFRSLDFFNRLFFFARPFQFWLPKLVDGASCRSLSILDVGAGNGRLGRVLGKWAQAREWNWKVTNLDSSWLALRLDSHGHKVAASATALPFRDGSFDAVIASQMAHHLDDAAAEQLLHETWRVTRKALILSDLYRSVLLYLTIWVISRLRRHPASFRADALLSVRRGWHAKDLQSLATRAGLSSARIQVQFCARVILLANK